MFRSNLESFDKRCHLGKVFLNLFLAWILSQCLKLIILCPHGSNELRIMLTLISEWTEFLIESFHDSIQVLALLHFICIDTQYFFVQTGLIIYLSHNIRSGIKFNFNKSTHTVSVPIFSSQVLYQHSIPKIVKISDNASISKYCWA